MTVIIDNQVLSVTDLFKKYDLDEISEILVKIKKEVFIRTNDIKKVIGSNPELMIDFGENVLGIYNATKELTDSACELLNDIESFNNSLNDRISDIIEEDLPINLFSDQFEIKENKYDELYFEILQSFSNKDFISSYEKYLYLKQLLENLKNDLDHDILTNIDFLKQSIKSNCCSYIQSCNDLNGKEFSYLIIIRFLLEIEDKDLEKCNIKDIFDLNLKNAIILRVEENIQSLKDKDNTDENKNERFSDLFKMCTISLITLYKLKESFLNIKNELKNKEWFNLIYHENFEDSFNILENNIYIMNLKSVLLNKFEYLEKINYNESEFNFKYKILTEIYLSLFKTIEDKKGLEILKDLLFPILISVIENNLLEFTIKNKNNQLIDLLLNENNNNLNSNLIKNNNLDDTDLTKWLNSQTNYLQLLLNELSNIEEIFDNIGLLEKKQIIKNLSEKCFKSILKEFIDFNRNLFWSIKGKYSKKIPKIYIKNNMHVDNNNNNNDNIHVNIGINDIVINNNNNNKELFEAHKFINLLVDGKQLDIIESYLLRYFNVDEKDNFSFQTLLDNQCNFNNINWKLLIKINNEILISMKFLDNNNKDFQRKLNLNNICFVKTFQKLINLYISPECLDLYINKLRNLEILLYSILIHTEKQNEIISLYQSLIPLFNKDQLFNIKINNYSSFLNLYRQNNFDNNLFTPHLFLIHFFINLRDIGLQLNSFEQEKNFNLVCKAYLELYIQSILMDTLEIIIQYVKNTDLKIINEIKELLINIIFSLYSDLIFCLKFDLCELETSFNNSLSGLISNIKEVILDRLQVSNISDILLNIEHIISDTNLEIKEVYKLDLNKYSLSIESFFTSSTNRFSTLPLIKPSSIGTISNKISMANDKILKATVDYNSISNYNHDNNNDQYLLSHYSNIVKEHKKKIFQSKSSLLLNTTNDDISSNTNNINNNDKVSNWFSIVNHNSTTNINDNDTNNGNKTVGTNKKIDRQSIWQVSNLLKETVKDKVFGQRDE